MLDARDARNNKSFDRIVEQLQAQDNRQRETVSLTYFKTDDELGKENCLSDR